VNKAYKSGFLLTEIMITFSLFMLCVTLYAQMQWRFFSTERSAIDYLYALTLAKNSIEIARVSNEAGGESQSGQFLIKQHVTPLMISKNDNEISCYKIVATISKNNKVLVSLESAFLKQEAIS
jgi:Tfp pilus assembly protein PilV